MDEKIQKLSLYISNFYQKKTKCSNEAREELHFCLQYFIFNITVTGTIILINSLLGLFKECMLVLLTFSALRSSAGGYHCETYWRCYIVSNIMILIFSFLAHILIPFYVPCSILSCILGFYIYKKYVPKPNEHDEKLSFINKDEKKKRFLVTLLILINIITVGIALHLKLLVTGISMGILSVVWITSDKGEFSFRKVQKYI